MSALSIQPTYPIFTDIDGQPLEDGFVWIGTANLDPQGNPINVYWDKALTIPAAQPIRTLAGYPSNSGTPGRLYVDSNYSIRVMNKNGSTVYSSPIATEQFNDAVFSAAVNAFDVVYDPAGVGAQQTNVQAKLRQVVSVKDFGALGDGSGRTPADDGINVLAEPWNTWDNTPFKTNLPWSPYSNGVTFTPPRPQPFANDDTWDYIGCSLALWSAPSSQKSVYVPAGTYVINMSSATNKGSLTGLIIMKGMEQTIYGAGSYETTFTTKEGQSFFASNNVGVANAYQIFNFYRVGGPPTNIYDLAIIGPDSYQVGSQNLTLLWAQNINGVTFRDMWLSSAWYGIAATTNSGDSHWSRTTSEYCFGATLYTDASSEISADFCNIWASASVAGQKGIQALGRGSATNCRFVGFAGPSFMAASGIFNNNYVTSAGIGVGSNMIVISQDGVVVGNEITGGSSAAMLRIGRDSCVVGNTFNQVGEHACVNAGDGAAGSAINITINGNTMIKTNATPGAQNYAITSEEAGSSFTGGATPSLLIANNTFEGRALQQIGAATLVTNSFSGTISSYGSFIQKGDVIGNEILNGTNAGASYTLTLSGVIGVGQGAPRDLERLNLVSVVSSASGHIVRGWALYTSQYDGSAVLVATLGTSALGGTITFGVLGNNPTVTITNSSGFAANYVVRAIPLV